MSSVTKEKYLLHTKMETARMMLAFMCKEKLNQVAELFINTCPYLEYERAANEEGFAPFNFAYQPISDILHDYSQMQRKVSQLVQRYGSNLSYPRMMSDLEKIDYLLELQSNSQSQAVSQNVTLMGNGQDVHSSATGQTTAMNQFQGCEQYQGNDGAPYMLLRSCDATGPADEYSQGVMMAAPSAENYATTNLSAGPAPNQGTDAEAPTQYFLVDDNGNQQPITIEILPQNDAGCHGAAVQQPSQQSMTVSYASNELGGVSSYPEPAQTHHHHHHHHNHQPVAAAYQENVHVPPSDENTYSSARATAPQIDQPVPMPVFYTDDSMTISSGTEQNCSQQPQPLPPMRSEPQNNARTISDIPLTFGTNVTTSQCHFQPQENYQMQTGSSGRFLPEQPQIEVTVRESVTAGNFEPHHPPLVPQDYAENRVPASLTIDTGCSVANPPFCPANESSMKVTSSNSLLKVVRNAVPQKTLKQAQKIRSMDSTGVMVGSTIVQRIHTDERVPLVAKENSGPTHKPKRSEQTVFVSTTIQQGVRVKKIRPSKKEAASETVSSTTPVKGRRVTASPKSQQPSARKVSIPPQHASKPPVSAGDNVGPKPIDPVPAPAAPLSALDEWKRIRSINKSNFDDFARQEICKAEDRLQLIRNEQKRQKRIERMRLRKLADMENSNDPQQASEERGRSSTTVAPGQPAGGRKLTIGQKRKQAALERANAAKRKKLANGVTDESVSNADETITNANDSLERHAARMEAALATPLKPDEPPPAQTQQQQQEPPEQEKPQQQQQPKEKDPNTTVQPVSLSLSSATNMSFVVVSSESREPPQPSERTKEESVPKNPPLTDDLEIKQKNNEAPPPEEQQVASEQASNVGESVQAPALAPAPQVRPKVKVSFAVNKDLKNATARKSPRTKAPAKRRSDEGADKSDDVQNETNSSSSSRSSYSSSSESDSDSNSSFSTASSSSGEDENVREMVNNYKRFHGKDQPRTRSALAGRAHSTPVVAKPTMPRTVIPAKGAEQSASSEKDDTAETPQSEPPPEPAQGEEKTSDNSCISCSPVKRIEATVSRLAVMRDRPQMKPARRRPLPQQKRQTAVANARAKAVAAAATKSAPAAAPAAAPSTEVTTQPEQPPPPPPPVAKATPTTVVPLRTKTPRKQQLIPTKIDPDGTFIAPSPTPALSSQQRPKAPIPERQDAPSSKPSPGKTKAAPAAVPKRAPPARRLSVQTRQTKQLVVAVKKITNPEQQQPQREPVEEETPAPANVAPDTTEDLRGEGNVGAQKPNPEEGVAQDAIYAVLAQIHGK